MKLPNKLAGLTLFIGIALALGACTTQKEQWTFPEYNGPLPVINPDPPCTAAGYFTSNTPGKYYRCVFNNNRWLKYVFSCPTGQNYNQAKQKCE
ncbi:chitin-binding domain-containing protein [Pseudomonas sp. KBW05]|uniref:chitin-binding domain-containing protein n=1 Tax=Pseudomonas sp. KBW05 TaxID=2153360 RepID=UPI000F5AF513|nr:chitin-binding domain-containing protein [Pseudomonas sp. KBW05]RQO50483.1 hypothetical protein DBR46_21750 [Pseudomonas sp. KBW05]